MAIERRRKNVFAYASAFDFFQSRKTGTQERGFIDLNDERAQFRLVSVVMRVKAPELGLDECLRQCFETLGGAEPGEAIRQQANGRSEFARVTAPHQRIDAVGTDNEIGIVEIIEALNRAPIERLNSYRGRACNSCSSFRRPMAAKPTPSITTRSPRCTSAISFHDSMCGTMAA
jgi:hypothetical protein